MSTVTRSLCRDEHRARRICAFAHPHCGVLGFSSSPGRHPLKFISNTQVRCRHDCSWVVHRIPTVRHPGRRRNTFHVFQWTIIAMLSAILGGLSLTATLAWGRSSSLLNRQYTGSTAHSMNVTNCPGTFPPSSVELISMFYRLHFGGSHRV